jgi:hypothetical protein
MKSANEFKKMKRLLALAVFIVLIFTGCNQKNQPNYSEKTIDEQLIGTWLKFGPQGIFTIEFKESGIVETDMGNDGIIDVISEYKISGDTVFFKDIKGETCPQEGKYRVLVMDEYVAFDMLDDECGGRIKITNGYWTRPDYQEKLKVLEEEIKANPDIELLLTRARIFLSISQSKNAKADLDRYIQQDSSNARVFINRAATCFPHDMEDALADCNRAIELEPDNKNAYFLRGLALYDLGRKEEACDDFATAINLGFDILRIAEQEKCAEFWANN